MPPKIAIAGAGPAGLTLASLLRASSEPLDIVIYEKDASTAERSEKGGMLDLHSDTGLAALRAANLWEPLQKYARYEAQDMIFADKNAIRVLENLNDAEADRDIPWARPEIDRGRLQEILFESVPAGWIKWDSHLRSVSVGGMLSFDHGIEGPFDLIVGADGAWSKVRPLLTDVRPLYSGIGGFEMHIINPAQDHLEVSKMVGRGSYFAYSDCKALQAQSQGNGDIMVYAWDKSAEDYPKILWEEVAHDGEELKKRLLETLFQDWSPEMQACIRACSPHTVRPWPLYELPVGTSWEHKKGVTLIGDSAHVMSPFAGQGVNMAMKDALELSEAIMDGVKSGSDLDAAIDKFEKSMFPRVEGVMAMTMMMKTYQFREDSPLGLVEKMKEVMAGHGPEA